MGSNITIGQYYPEVSIIHKLDPRFKIIATLIYITVMFVSGNSFGYAVGGAFLFLVIILSKVPIKVFLRGIRGILFILLFTFVLNVFFTVGEDVIFEIGFLKVTETGLIMAIKMVVRLMLLVTGSSALTLTTTPIELTSGIEYLLAPTKKIGVPAHDIAMMMTITLRFIPILSEELEKIMKAQKARGANFETGSFISRIKNLIPILVPLILSAFRRAEDLADAMEARCYRGDIGRTKMNKMMLKKQDYQSMVCLSFFVVIVILTTFI